MTDIESAIKDILNEYNKEVQEGVKDAAKKVAKQAASDLKSASPKGGKYHGRYAAGWGTTDESSGNDVKITVHNKKDPGLAHLLEHGHVLRRGGRTIGKGFVPAIEHIAPIESQAVEDFQKAVQEVISG